MCNWHVPVCATCRIDMHPGKTGISFVEQTGEGIDARPYKIWSADMWECPECGARVVVGFGRTAHTTYHEDTFNTILEQVKQFDDTIIEKRRYE